MSGTTATAERVDAWMIHLPCFTQAPLLKFQHDRCAFLRRAREMRRLGLTVLNYVVTHHQVLLLVLDTRKVEIHRTIRLLRQATATDYQRRRPSAGPLWDPGYECSAIAETSALRQALVRLDLHMVRAGAVRHPRDWRWGGYREIQGMTNQHWLVNQLALMRLLGYGHMNQLRRRHSHWIEQALQRKQPLQSPARAVSRRAGCSDWC